MTQGFLVHILWPAVLFVLFNLAFVPARLPAGEWRARLLVPLHLWKIALSESWRRNHALEHATINILEETWGPQILSGTAMPGGFVLRGIANATQVEAAARQGLLRLGRGERRLAIHDQCGTSVVIANLLTSALAVLAVYAARRADWLMLLFAMLAANAAGPALGRFVQRWITTSPRVGKMEIASVVVSARQAGFAGRAMPMMPVQVLVTTRDRG
jgi:hypothetical protein